MLHIKVQKRPADPFGNESRQYTASITEAPIVRAVDTTIEGVIGDALLTAKSFQKIDFPTSLQGCRKIGLGCFSFEEWRCSVSITFEYCGELRNSNDLIS